MPITAAIIVAIAAVTAEDLLRVVHQVAVVGLTGAVAVRQAVVRAVQVVVGAVVVRVVAGEAEVMMMTTITTMMIINKYRPPTPFVGGGRSYG